MVVLLREAGLVRAVRGINGGYLPAKPPHDVPVVAVIEAAYGKAESDVGGGQTLRHAQDFRRYLENVNHSLLARITVADVVSGDLARHSKTL
jgi:DNA-binding IscR family transcriptional regulator